MEQLSHSLRRKKEALATVADAGFTPNSSFNDVFGGPPKFVTFSPRSEDYSDVFGCFHASRALSIPVLDLPVIDEADVSFDVRSSEFDYSEVFGGFDGFGFAVPYEELLKESKKDNDFIEEIWTSADTASLAEDSDPSFSGTSHYWSSGNSHQSHDEGINRFNISYQKFTQRNKEDTEDGRTHSQLHVIPEFTFVADKTTPSQDFKEGTTERSDSKYRKNCHYSNGTFVTVSEISLKTEPSQVPPPSRPPPALAVKKGEWMTLPAGDIDGSPPFFDVEVDASSSVKASVAAMVQAMDKAQAKLKNAKEIMERKKDDNVGTKTAVKKHREELIITEEVGEWKEASEFFELVKTDESKKEFGQGKNERVMSQKVKETNQEENKKKSRMAIEHEEKGKTPTKADGCQANEKATEIQSTKHKTGNKETMKHSESEENVKIGSEEKGLKEEGKNEKVLMLHKRETKNGKVKEKKKGETGKKLRMAAVHEEKEKIPIKADGSEVNENPINIQLMDNKTDNKEIVKHNENEVNVGIGSEGNRLWEQGNNEKVKEKTQEENKTKLWIATEHEEKQKTPTKPDGRGANENVQSKENKRNNKETVNYDENEKNIKIGSEENRLMEQGKIEKGLLQHKGETKNEKVKAKTQEENNKKLRMTAECEAKEKTPMKADGCESNENPIEIQFLKENIIEKNRLQDVFEREENERRLKEAFKQEENERRVKETIKQEENDKRMKDAIEREESENKLREVLEKAREREVYVKRLKETLEQEANKIRLKEAVETEEKQQRLALLREVNEKRLTDVLERKENEKKPNEKEVDGKRLNPALASEDNETRVKVSCKNKQALKEAHERKDDEKIAKSGDGCQSEETERSNEEGETIENKELDKAHEQEKSKENINLSNYTCKSDKIKSLHETQNELVNEENGKIKTEIIVLKKKPEEVRMKNDPIDDSSKPTITVQECLKRGVKQIGKGNSTEPLVSGLKRETCSTATSEGKGNIETRAQQVRYSQSMERKEKKLSEEREKEERMNREKEIERDHLKKLEEEREREREREKDRIAVERATKEARERAILEARERAERAAVERACNEARQRALSEARERLEKACAEARFSEKAFMEDNKTAFGARDNGMRQNFLSSDVQNLQCQGTASSDGFRYPYSSAHTALYTADRFDGAQGESAQRSRARLERHQRTVERAAKALAEKNRRDLLAQRDQEERNRLAEALDAEVKRWSAGKEGNLRALLSTLQYILGPDSGWQPVPLTGVITAVAVKKAYRKATLCVHPDKLQQRSASIQQKYICEKVFDLLKEAWGKFNSEER